MLPIVLSSSSSSVFKQKYDVFLSFISDDSSKNFTDHLYATLTRSGIVTFRGDQKLEVGEEIDAEIFKVIQESWCSIIVFSKTYAFSGWCLDELVEILHQKNKRGHKVFPIFYDVDPSDMRKQTGNIQKAFLIHDEKCKESKDKIQRWRCTLTEVANLKGWHLNNRHESEFMKDIVKKISAKLCQSYSTLPNELVGIESRLEELHSKLEIGDDDVRIVGICGMGGIGKTTLARIIYTQMSSHFDSKSFLADVREVSEKWGLISLQKQLLSQTIIDESFNFFNIHEGNAIISRRLSNRKVLIVIDDVDSIPHLKCLVGSRDWFGLGSRILVTTRDEHLLLSYQVDDVYKPVTLNLSEALHLLSLKAFNSAFVPENDFIQLSKCVVEYAGGLPLALEVLGSFLCGRNASQWRSAIERLKSDFHKEIHERLQISFDGLEETEKNIFLDIACFFKGKDKDFVIKILDGPEFFPNINIDVLSKKNLITINEFNELRMHDLLQEMGRKIVKQKSLHEPGRRCRLWKESDIYNVLIKNTATKKVEGMVVDNQIYQVPAYNWEQNKTMSLSAAFLKMKKLRLLKVFGLPITRSLTHLSNELRLFEWHGYPLKSLPSNFQANKLVALIVPYSGITQLWTGNKRLNNLKFINLKGCQKLIRTLDFRRTPNLESLILDGCIKIKELHSSMGQLSNLVLLNLKDCRSLLSLPNTIDGLKSLKTLNLSGCSKIENLPPSLQQVESLEELDLSSTTIRELESFIFKFKNLKFLSLERCKGIPSQLQVNWSSFFKMMRIGNPNSRALMLPPLSGLRSLTSLNLSDCNLGEGTIPSDIFHLFCLRYLDLSGNNFITLPETLSRLSNLFVLQLSNCKWLNSVLNLRTKSLRIDGCTSLEVIANVTPVCDLTETIIINGINCHRLVENNKTLGLLKRHLKEFAKKRQPFSIFIPGSGIPEWFGQDYHAKFDYYESSSLKIPLPPNIQNDNQWVGVALCNIMAPAFDDDTWNNDESIQNYPAVHGRNSHEYDWDFPQTNHIKSGLDFSAALDGSSTSFMEPNPNNIRSREIWPLETSNRWFQYWSGVLSIMSSDHLLLHYLPPDIFYSFLLWGDEIEFSFEKFFVHKLLPNDIESSLQKLIVDIALPKVKKCGIRLVYEKDLEEMGQLKDQHWYNTESCADYNGATSINGTFLKRKRDINDCEEVGPTETKERQPPKKLQKVFNFIMGKKL